MNTFPAIDRPLWKRLLLRRLKMLLGLIALILLIGGGSYLFAPQWLMQANTWRAAQHADLDTHQVMIGDTHWTFYEGGQGPTIVLLHGYAADRTVWLKVAALLSQHFHLIIPDLPGWGDSSHNPNDQYDISHQAARLHAFVHTLQLQHFVLVGHSMGGAIAGVYASEHPDQVRALALVSSFGLKFVKNTFARQALAGHNPFAVHDRAGFERMLRLVFRHPPSLPSRFVDVLVKRSEANDAFLQKVFKQLQKPDQYTILDDRLKRLTMPVLGLWCRNDKVIDVSALNTLRNGLTQAPTISASVLNGCGHLPEVEKPTETAQILAGFAIAH